MKLHILFPLKDGPSGGGNQFLLALREYLRNLGSYSDIANQADAIIFNSYPFGSAANLYRRVAALKRERETIAILHRVDGPISVVRGNTRDLPVDQSIVNFNNLLSDATIFQSQFSRSVCHGFGIGKERPSTVIVNAPDSRWFFSSGQRHQSTVRDRIKIIISSWSSNWRKGFDIYSFLDQALDYDRYELTFVGNSPVKFKNIKIVSPLDSRQLGESLRTSDIYLTASVDDPCSNAVVEALHCGLPVVARNSGGHHELVGDSGVLFSGRNDVIAAIDKAAAKLGTFEPSGLPNMEQVAAEYLDFAHKVCTSISRRQNFPPTFVLPKLWMGVAHQRFWSSLTGRVTRYLPLREARFHAVSHSFRYATWESIHDGHWTDKAALTWVRGVLARLPLFLDSMRHPSNATLYRYSQTGDLQAKPSLASSVFATKIMTMARLGSEEDRRALAQHILSFQRGDGSISDPWVASHSRWGRLVEALRTRGTSNLFHGQTVRAETRQSMAALRSLGTKPPIPFADLPNSVESIKKYVDLLNWTRPWNAASHISHLAFFIVQNANWFGIGQVDDAIELLTEIERVYRRDDGAWYSKGSTISNNQKINGAMKMVTALDAAGLEELQNPEGLIDICLSAINDGHACNHFNVICVLHRCLSCSTYRKNEIRKYMLDRLRRYHDHYWPWQGGFSFFPASANSSYYNARVSTGMAEPDLHGTVLMLWGIVLICDAMGWANELELQRPLT